MNARQGRLAMVLCLLALPALAQQSKPGGSGVLRAPLNHAPQVSLYTPTSGQQFTTGNTVQIQGAATDSDPGDSISSVEFLVDGSVVATQGGLGPNYSHNWTATTGSHTVQIRATDSFETDPATTTSPSRSITVVVPNQLPTVSLTAPANGAVYAIGASVPLKATASDSDGNINRVEFLVDAVEVAQDANSPYSKTWTATLGSHTVQARAVDNQNGKTTTAAITIQALPAIPALTVPGSSTTGSYSASWTTASGATHYELSEKVGSGSWSVIQDTSATSKSLSGKANGSYSYRVRACAGSGTANCSAYSSTETIAVAIPPPVPTLTLPGSSSTGSYSASWTTSSGATHYELSEQVGSGSWSVIQDTSATSKSLSGQDDGSYSYRVRACTGSGTGNCSAYSATKTITVALPPDVPTLTVPGSSTTGSYSASWTTSSGATHYELSEKVGSGSWSVIQDTSATSKSISGQDDGSYSYRVRACAGSGTGNCSAYSSTKTITVTIPVAPQVPALDLPEADADGGYVVAWSSTDDPQRYELDEQVGAGAWNQVYSGSAQSKTFSGKAAQVYGYRVRACDGTACSADAGGTLVVLGVPVIAGLSSPNETGDYTLTWSAVPGSPWYRVYESTDGGATWSGNLQNSPATSMGFEGKPEGSYSYKVRACKGTVCGSYSAVVGLAVDLPDPTPPVPTLTLPGSSTTGSYTASWTTSSGATHYELSEKVGSGSWSVIQDTSATSKSISGKDDGSYSYRVRACSGSGTGNCSTYSSTETITVTIPPDVPTLTVPAASTTGSYTASWTTSSGATHYELSEKVGSGSWSVIQDTSATSKSISGKDDGSYSYRVRACTGSGTGNCSTYSTTKTITVTIPPDVPTLTLPATSTTGNYSASWTTSSGATHYELSEKIGSGSWSVIQDTSATSKSISGKDDGSYSYRVRACTGSGTGNCSTYSTTKTITVTIPPDVPTLTLPATSTTGNYSASWTTSSGATHYELSEKIGSGSWAVIQDTSATSKSISGQDDGSYSYRVRACTGSGTGNCSTYSTTKTITVTIPPDVPTLTVPASSTTGSYTASWSTSSGATHYELSEKVGSGSWAVIQDTSATSKSISGQDDGSYSYRVRACTGSGTGNCSTYSTTKTITVTIPPDVPTLTVPASSTTGSYTASWTTSSGATHYELSEKIGSGSWSVIQDTSATSKALSGKADGSYSYRVRACTGSGTDNCSAYSTTKTIAVAIPPPPPATITRSYTYNAYQELCRSVEPETGATLYGYDGAGNLKWRSAGLTSTQACEANGTSTPVAARRVDRTYDARNRIATLSFPDGNGNQTWTYTPDGLPDTVTTANDAGASSVTNSYTYNKRRLRVGEGQVQTGNPTAWAMGYGFDANAHPASLVYPDGLTLTITANALGQPTNIASAGQTYASAIAYYPNGALQQFTYGNGIVHTLTRNARGLPLRSRDADGSSSVHDDTYTYDANGNVAAIADGVGSHDGNRAMTYDALDRLTDVTSPMYDPSGAHYTYDVLDNITSVTAPSTNGDLKAYCYDNHWQLTNVKIDSCTGTSEIGLGYDVQGNLANKNGVLYGFDYGNRLRSAGTERYRYDAWGRRVRTDNINDDGLIYSLYGQDGALYWTRDERSGKRVQYVSLGGSLIAQRIQPIGETTEVITWQHTDALGSPVAVTNASRTVIQTSKYEPYGYLLNRPLEDGPGFTGHVMDAATGLIYMQQRYMGFSLPRFLSADPVTAYEKPFSNFNPYVYAYNNPYKFTDLDGRLPGWANRLLDTAKSAVIRQVAITASKVIQAVPDVAKAVVQSHLNKNVYSVGLSVSGTAGGPVVGNKITTPAAFVTGGISATANTNGQVSLSVNWGTMGGFGGGAMAGPSVVAGRSDAGQAVGFSLTSISSHSEAAASLAEIPLAGSISFDRLGGDVTGSFSGGRVGPGEGIWIATGAQQSFNLASPPLREKEE